MSFCTVPDCDREAHAGGLCFKHYMRVRRHGAVDGGRNGDGRVKSHHPLWEMWKGLLATGKRYKNIGIAPRWNEFWDFVSDVGERPTNRHKLRRINPKKALGPGNWEWRAPISEIGQLSDKNSYMREFRLKNLTSFRNADLKRRFGITLDQYNEMLQRQNGVCAICGNRETMIDRRNGRPFALAVDHCHAAEKGGKMKIRSLLCCACNSGLGRFKDNPELLQKAIAYLRSHGGTG